MPAKSITQLRYHKDRDVINRLSKNLRIILLRRDKSRTIVVMDREKYPEKSMNIVNTKKFWN